MTTVGKLITLLILGALFLAAMTHAAGFSAMAMSGGSVLDQTLALESGQGVSAGSHGTVSYPGGGSVSLS